MKVDLYEGMTESQIMKLILGRLDAYRRYGKLHYIRINSGRIMTKWGNCVKLAEAGTADLLLILPAGRSLWVEIKTTRKGSKQEAPQRAFEVLMLVYGHDYIIVKNPDELDIQLEARGIQL